MVRAFQAISIVKKKTHGQYAPVDARLNAYQYVSNYFLVGQLGSDSIFKVIDIKAMSSVIK